MSSPEIYYSFEDIKRSGNVVPLSVVEGILKQTEPVEGIHLPMDGSTGEVSVTMPDNWNMDLKALDDSTITSCKIHVAGSSYTFTKGSILSLMRKIGISDRYATKTPGNLLAPHLDYWLNNSGGQKEAAVKMLVRNGYVVGFMKPDTPIVSNLEILNYVKRYLKDYFKGSELYVDPNVVNNFVDTEFRIILPKVAFTVDTVRNGEQETDQWHYGIHVSNSLTGSITSPLTISGFLIEEKSLSGVLPEYSQIASYSKHITMDSEDLSGWVKSTLDQVFAILPAEVSLIQVMPEHSLKGKMGPTTSDIFTTMKIHRKVQEMVLDNIADTGDMTPYGIMFALGKAVSGNTTFASKVVSHVQRVAGTLPSRSEDICDGCGRLHFID